MIGPALRPSPSSPRRPHLRWRRGPWVRQQSSVWFGLRKSMVQGECFSRCAHDWLYLCGGSLIGQEPIRLAIGWQPQFGSFRWVVGAASRSCSDESTARCETLGGNLFARQPTKERYIGCSPLRSVPRPKDPCVRVHPAAARGVRRPRRQECPQRFGPPSQPRRAWPIDWLDK